MVPARFGRVAPLHGSHESLACVPFHIQCAINHQVELKFKARGWVEGNDEGPDYSVVVTDAGRFLLFTRGFRESLWNFDLSPFEADRVPIS